MPILFYDHLVSKEDICQLIADSEEAENNKNKALQLIDDIIFQNITHYVLNKLEEKKHATYLNMVHDCPYDPQIIIYLKEHIHPDVEDEIKKEIEKVLHLITKDMLP